MEARRCRLVACMDRRHLPRYIATQVYSTICIENILLKYSRALISIIYIYLFFI